MSNSLSFATPPSRLLLATDLSARCDRALDRALQLAGEWGAGLVALNVLEVPLAPDRALAWAAGESDESLARVARAELVRDLGDRPIHTEVRIGRGDAATVIRDMATSTGCGLIVTGMARNETFGRFLVGSTVERLARTVSQPLLVVRRRARGAYERIVVAADFSPPSRHALHAAVHFFPGRSLVVYHARHVPFSGLAGETASPRSGEAGTSDRDRFLAASDLPAAAHANVRMVVESGALESMLASYVRAHDVDLVVMGTHGGGSLTSVALGSAAARLLDWLPCDTMIVRAPPATA